MENKYEVLKDYLNQPLTYRKLCEIIDEKMRNGSTVKNAHLKQIGQYVEIVKENRNIYIKRLYNEDEIKQYLIKDLGSECFKVKKSDYHKAGVYKIQADNYIYIGQTVNFRKRFNSHFTNASNFHIKTSQLLEQGAIFEIIELEDDLDKRLQKEAFWIKYYSDNVDFDCINSYLNEKSHKKHKRKYKTIKVKTELYDKAIQLLQKEGII